MSDDFGLWDVMVSIFWFTLLLSWISLLVQILGDVFRDGTLSGGKKAMWTAFIALIPWLGAIVYLCARGGSMHERNYQAAVNRMAAYDAQRQAPLVTDELRGLAELRETGVLTPVEYDQAKARVLA